MSVGKSRQIIGLDLVRFAAAMLVALYHLAYFWWLPAGVGEHYRVGLQSVEQVFRWGWIGVPIFFVLSGFVIAYSADGRSVSQFVRSRLLRLYPTAWMCATLTLVLARYGAFGDYFLSIILWPGGPWISGVYWTLAVEMAFYAFVAVALAFRFSLDRVALILGGISAAYWDGRTADFVTGGHFRPLFLAIEANEALLAVAYGCYFALGISLWSIAIHGRGAGKTWLFAICCAAALIDLLSSGRFYVASQGGRAWQMAVPAAIGAIGLAAMIASLRWNGALHRLGPKFGRTARLLGLITYPLYLLHSEIGREAMLGMTAVPPLVALVGALLAVILLAYIVVLIEPVPRTMLAGLIPGPSSRRGTRC